jgi:macrolide phosphotransferase
MTTDPTVTAAMLRAARDRGLPLRADSAVLDESGWDFFVVRAISDDGQPWILRRARRPEMAAAVEAEARVLSLVAPRLPVAVPEWVSADPELIAYPMLPDEPAASEDPGTYELHWRIDRERPPEAYTNDLGRLMATLHAMPVAQFKETGIPVRDPADVRDQFARRLEIGRSELSMHPTWFDRGRRWVEDDRLWSVRTVLIHGDLHPGHTLVNSAGAITGVLDWTDAEIGDPGQEFVEASRKFEPPVWDLLVASYQRSGGPSWPGLGEHVRNGIAFAPLALGVLGLTSDQPRYVAAARRKLSVPAG